MVGRVSGIHGHRVFDVPAWHRGNLEVDGSMNLKPRDEIHIKAKIVGIQDDRVLVILDGHIIQVYLDEIVKVIPFTKELQNAGD
jgi:hypothetical protein